MILQKNWKNYKESESYQEIQSKVYFLYMNRQRSTL